MKTTVYLSLGANVGDRETNLRETIRSLQGLGSVKSVSSLYETEPVEVMSQQPWFLNCVVEMETQLGPEEFLDRMLALERAMGRTRTEYKGPRTIDIDILLFGGSVLNTPDLTVPHPGLHQRRFVLEPLAEIAPEVKHPALKKTARELLNALAANSGTVRRYKP